MTLCAHYEIATLELELVLMQVVELYRIDMATRQDLRAITPLPWDTTPRHGEEL